MGSRFSELLFLDVPDHVRTCGVRGISSSLDEASKKRDSVQLNSWKSFLVTLPSISSETWVMYSSAIPGLHVFCDCLFLVSSGVSVETSANFLLLFKIAINLREKLIICEDWMNLHFINKFSISSFVREKVSMLANSKRWKIWVLYQKGYSFYNSSTFVSPIYTVSLAGNISVYRPIQRTNREKYFDHFTYRRNCLLWREINTLPSISPLIDLVFSIFRQKNVQD